MIRQLSSAAAPALAAAVLTLAPATADAARGRVQGLLVRPAGTHSAKLSWDAVKGARRYRVMRRGHVVRTTRRRSMTVGLTKSRVPYQVAAVGGRPSQRVIVVAGHSPPRAPVAAAVSGVTSHTATLTWGRSRAVGARIAGYRVVPSKGKPRMVKRTRIGLEGLRSATTLTYRILAIDTMGWASRRSGPIRVVTGHLPPRRPGIPTPIAVGDTTLSLAWQPSQPRARTQIRGYRLMRDGVVVGQIPGTRIDLTNLAPKSVHDWTVAAIDTQGMMSKPSPAAHVVQADPPPTMGSAHVYLLASTDSSFQAFQRHYRQIGYVYPTFYDCNRSTGAIEGRNDPLILRYAQDRKVKVLPRFNCQSGTILHKILTDPATRAAWLDGMTGLAVQNGYDGINVDFEQVPAGDRAALTSFIQQLSARLHAQGKLLSQAVSAKVKDIPDHPRSGAFDYPALSSYDDFVFVMAWGIHWSTSAPGPQDDLSWVKQVVNYVATMPNPQKWVIGTMLYGFDWPAGGGPSHPGTALHYADVPALLARYHVTPMYDQTADSWHFNYTDASGVGHEVWYSDAPVTGRRVDLALQHGFEVGLWRIGQEDERIWQNPQLPGGQ